ncbi:MAG: FkbM family methyltransferase [Marmoricola sp.]
MLLDLLGSRTPWRRDELLYELRNGLHVHCPNVPGSRVPVYELFAEDTYRFADLLDGLGEHLTALDIGAQIGCFSMALTRARPHARIHAYEASPTTGEWLERNVADNRLGDRVLVHHEALSDHDGTIGFRDNGAGSGLNGLTAAAGSGRVLQVPCAGFAEAVRRVGTQVDLVKIDTEGAEYDIVLGSPAEAWDGIRRVVLEYHPVPGRSWSELADFFAGVGLGVVAEDSVTPGWGAVWLSRDA